MYGVGGGNINNVLIEEFIQQHQDINELNPSSVNSIRVYALRGRDGVVRIISASIRVGGRDVTVDNFHCGGIGYPIDIDTGVVYQAGSGIYGKRHIYHPSTNAKMVGFEIPNWHELKLFVNSAMNIIPQARLIAWDVAVLPRGFEMIEGNYNGDPGFMQAPSKEGKKKVIINSL